MKKAKWNDKNTVSREDGVVDALKSAQKVNDEIFADRIFMLLGNGGEVCVCKGCTEREYVGMMTNAIASDPSLFLPTFEALLKVAEHLGIKVAVVEDWDDDNDDDDDENLNF